MDEDFEPEKSVYLIGDVSDIIPFGRDEIVRPLWGQKVHLPVISLKPGISSGSERGGIKNTRPYRIKGNLVADKVQMPALFALPSHDLVNALFADPEHPGECAQGFASAMTCSDLGVTYMLLGSDFGNGMGWKNDSEVQLDHHAACCIA